MSLKGTSWRKRSRTGGIFFSWFTGQLKLGFTQSQWSLQIFRWSQGSWGYHQAGREGGAREGSIRVCLILTWNRATTLGGNTVDGPDVSYCPCSSRPGSVGPPDILLISASLFLAMLLLGNGYLSPIHLPKCHMWCKGRSTDLKM